MPFARFIKELSGQLTLSLPDLMVVRALRSKGDADIAYLSKVAQRPTDYMEHALQDLRRRKIVRASRGGRYALAEEISNQLARYDDEGQFRLPLDS